VAIGADPSGVGDMARPALHRPYGSYEVSVAFSWAVKYRARISAVGLICVSASKI
jgi:hypothetical protein